MNKIYKVIWSKTRNCYVAVAGRGPGDGDNLRRAGERAGERRGKLERQ